MNKTRQIRDLARQVLEYASGDKNEIKREMWKLHNNLKWQGPAPILLSLELPTFEKIFPEDCVRAIDPVYRHVEFELRKKLWYASLESDMVIEPWINMNAIYFDDSTFMWGVEMQQSHIGEAGTVFNGELEYPDDLDKMHIPFLRMDGTRTLEAFDRATELLDGLLDIRMEWRHRHLVQPNFGIWTIQFIGQQRFLEWCTDYPYHVHRFIGIMAKTFIQHNLDMERRGRLTDNHCFVQDFYPWHGEIVDQPKLSDLWVNSESQDFHGVSPEMLEDYFLVFLRPIFAMFGQTQFGCCESLNNKLHLIKDLPNLRRITISEHTDWDYAIDTLGSKYVYSVRPVLVDTLYVHNEEQLREDMMKMAHKFRGLAWEVNFSGGRFTDDKQFFHKWVKIARKAVAA